MKKNSRLSLIAICSIGLILIIAAIFILFNPTGIVLLFAVWVGISPGFEVSNELLVIISLIGIISLIIGIIFVALGLILGLRRIPKFVNEKLKEAEEKKEKEDYKDVNWLKHQYYDLGRTVQDIADEQNVSMIVIRKWVDKLQNTS